MVSCMRYLPRCCRDLKPLSRRQDAVYLPEHTAVVALFSERKHLNVTSLTAGVLLSPRGNKMLADLILEEEFDTSGDSSWRSPQDIEHGTS